MVKALGAQRESEGVVVPLIGVRDAPGGKGPCFDHVRETGKREGMTGSARSNSPGKSRLAVADDEPLCPSGVKVRELQRALWAAAKQSSGRRFHALFDRICKGDVLWEAWFRVCKNKGAAGVDRVTLVAVEDYGVDRMLRELRDDLRTGRYRPAPARRVEIPKPQGGKRPLGIPMGGRIVTGRAVTIWSLSLSRIRSIRCWARGWRCCSSSAAARAAVFVCAGLDGWAGHPAGVVDRSVRGAVDAHRLSVEGLADLAAVTRAVRGC